jgi:hypothetical protein
MYLESVYQCHAVLCMSSNRQQVFAQEMQNGLRIRIIISSKLPSCNILRLSAHDGTRYRIVQEAPSSRLLTVNLHVGVTDGEESISLHSLHKVHAEKRLLYFFLHEHLYLQTNKQIKTKQTPWSESASELYRPSDVVSVTDPYSLILGFLDQSRCFVFQVTPRLYSRG